MPCDPMPLGWAGLILPTTAEDRRRRAAHYSAQRRIGLGYSRPCTHIWSILIEMARSELFHSYGMFHPTAPNFLRSMITAW